MKQFQSLVIRVVLTSSIGVGRSVVEPFKAHFNELRIFVSCRRGHGSDWAIPRRVTVRPNSKAGADAEGSEPHHQGSTAFHRPRLKRQRLRPTLGCQVHGKRRFPGGRYSGRLKSPTRLIGCGDNQPDDLSKAPKPRTNTETDTRSLQRMQPIDQRTNLNSSLPSNKPMERTLSRCALQRRSSAR